MPAKRSEGPDKAAPEPRTTRASISFPQEIYATVEQIARGKKVSVAWVVREATEQYIKEQWPLLSAVDKPGP
ncbi:CopG family transcriptional regulator [Luteimonas sp. SJ-92]|uniref:CopG family transcriptional regulator n=1 Tax=Luteimonas salinisoli TaxID=2752307 RepID=A0A853JD30_9GAMM|nr:ribbon-helix-helix domain-containing protein [Luteimonas salinisoli]NZA27193.1 CopG family transcriptional regulator [Luteimonas salinisoli]